MVNFSKAFVGVAAIWASGALAHERELTETELEARELELGNTRRALDFCMRKMESNGMAKRHIDLRAARADELRAARGIKRSNWKRDMNSDYSSEASAKEIFGRQGACILASDAMVGPYYVDGELIRNDIVEDQKGVELNLDLTVVDTSTCEPISEMYVDAWQANATGVYGGVVARGNGNTGDQSNINSTFGRGIAATDADGVVNFRTLVPGHYTGRAIHIHVITHQTGSELPNGTFHSTGSSHVGQIYFEPNLIQQVEATPPYSSNQQPFTPNDQDFILQQQLRQSQWSPIVETRLLGDTIEDGIYAWITLAIDTSARFQTPPAAHWTDHGGVPAGKRHAAAAPKPAAEPESSD